MTGTSDGRTTHADYATVAYSAATGRQLWASRYHGPANNGGAHCVAVSPAGTRVFVTGWSEGRTSYDYATVAYRGLRPPALPGQRNAWALRLRVSDHRP